MGNRLSPEEQAEADSERGYSESSARETRLREWFSLREADGGPREFKQLVARLWQRKFRTEHPDLKLAANRRWIGNNRKRFNDWYRRKRAAITKATVIECRSRACDIKWCRVPGVKKVNKYCSNECERAERNQRYYHDRRMKP